MSMGKFLNSEIAREEEAAARENQQSAELLDALGRIAELNMKLLAMSEVVGEMALENAMLRVELKMNPNPDPTPGPSPFDYKWRGEREEA